MTAAPTLSPAFAALAPDISSPFTFKPVSPQLSARGGDSPVPPDMDTVTDEYLRGMDIDDLVHFTRLLEVVRSARKDGKIAENLETLVPLGSGVTNRNVARAMSTHELHKERSEEGSKMLNQYLVLDDLGKGAQGKVKLAYDTIKNTTVAIKIVRKPKGVGAARNYAQQESLKREIAVMKKLRHRNIVALYEVIDDPGSAKMYIVMQHIDHGAIGKVLPNLTCNEVPHKVLMKYLRQLSAGLLYLHRHKIVHRDIKPENILVNTQNEAFLADFGVSEISGRKVSGMKGTFLYMSPELLVGSEVDGYAVDMWAFGVTIWVLLTGRMPFSCEDDIRNEDFNLILSPPHNLPHWEEMLKTGLLCRDPQMRWTAKDVHSFVKEHQHDDDDELGSMLFDTVTKLENLDAVTSVVEADENALSCSSSVIDVHLSGNHVTAAQPHFPRRSLVAPRIVVASIQDAPLQDGGVPSRRPGAVEALTQHARRTSKAVSEASASPSPKQAPSPKQGYKPPAFDLTKPEGDDLDDDNTD